MLEQTGKIRNLTKLGFELSLFIGFITLNIYFFNIQFFPIVDLYSIAYLAIVAACLGIWIFIIMVLPFSFGPYLWMELLKKKEVYDLIFKEEADVFIKSEKNDFINLTDKARQRLFFYYVCSIIAVYLSLLIISHMPSWILGVYFLFGIMMKSLYLFNNKNNNEVIKNKKPKNTWSNSTSVLIFKIYGASIIPGICLLFPTLMLIKFSFIKEEALTYFFIFTLIFLSGVSLIPLVKNWRVSSWVITVSTLVILFSLLCFGGFGELSKKIVHVYKFAIKNVSIGVDEIGCQIFKEKNPSIKCNPTDKVFSIKNVNVLWRVGEYYIQFIGPNHRHEEVILSSTHVHYLDPVKLANKTAIPA